MQQRHHHGAHRKVRFLPWSRLLSWQGTIFSLCSKSSPLLPPAAGSVSQQEHEPLALLSTAEPGLHLLAGRGGAQTLFERCSPWIGVGSGMGSGVGHVLPLPQLQLLFQHNLGPLQPQRAWRPQLPGWLSPGGLPQGYTAIPQSR